MINKGHGGIRTIPTNIKYVTGIRVKPRRQEAKRNTEYPIKLEDVIIFVNLEENILLSKKYIYKDIENMSNHIPSIKDFVLFLKIFRFWRKRI